MKRAIRVQSAFGVHLARAVLVLLSVFLSAQKLYSQTLDEYWVGDAIFIRDEVNTGMGGAFGMHFISEVWDQEIFHSYYINGY